MNKYIIYIGMGNNPYTLEQTKKLIVDTLSDVTLSYCIGFYKGEEEQTIKIEKYTEKNINKAVQFLCRQLKQECILIEQQQTNSYLIYGQQEKEA